MHRGFLKLHRMLLDWEWYQDTNVKVLFIHLLLKANVEDKQWQGKTIRKGELITSISNLGMEVNLSNQQIRTALKKLVDTQSITVDTTSKFTHIKLVKYNDFNGKDFDNQQTNNNQITNEQQSNNNQITTTKEVKKLRSKEDKKNITKKDLEDIYKNLIPEDIINLFEEYLQVRKELKMKETVTTIKLLCNKLKDYKLEEQKEMLENAIVNNWKSVYPTKQNETTSIAKEEEKKFFTDKKIVHLNAEEEKQLRSIYGVAFKSAVIELEQYLTLNNRTFKSYFKSFEKGSVIYNDFKKRGFIKDVQKYIINFDGTKTPVES